MCGLFGVYSAERDVARLTYFGLFAFTFLVYFRPYEWVPALSWLSRSALVMAVLTLAVFIPTQLGLENKITAPLREVKFALALLVTGLLSIRLRHSNCCRPLCPRRSRLELPP